jgi:hypothetical protein
MRFEMKLYDMLDQEGVAEFSPIITKWGDDTEFEAISRIAWDDETGDWDGYLIFKDERFSPADPDIPELQFQHRTPNAGNGVLANNRAGQTWETLISIFKSLMNQHESAYERIHHLPLETKAITLKVTKVEQGTMSPIPEDEQDGEE